MVLSDANNSDSGPTLSGHVVTKIFRHDCQARQCPSRWSIRDNHHDEEKVLFDAIATDPIVHRHYLNGKKWLTDSFTIQSPEMRAFLKSALANYQDFDPGLDGWTFRSPYKALVHRWDRILELSKSAAKETEQSVNSLVKFLHPILEVYIQAQANINKTGQISFADIWQIFPPGELVMTTLHGVEIMCRVTRYEFSRQGNSWSIKLQYVDWNGQKCGFAKWSIDVSFYAGERHVSSLPVYPVKFCESVEEAKERLLKRGRLFEAIRGYHFKSCTGTQVLLEESLNEERPISGRVIIDTHAYYQSRNRKHPSLGSLESEPPSNNPKLLGATQDTTRQSSMGRNPAVPPSYHDNNQGGLVPYNGHAGNPFAPPTQSYSNFTPVPNRHGLGPEPIMNYGTNGPYHPSYPAQSSYPTQPPQPQDRRPMAPVTHNNYPRVNGEQPRGGPGHFPERRKSFTSESDYTDDEGHAGPRHNTGRQYRGSLPGGRRRGFVATDRPLATGKRIMANIEARSENLDRLTDEQCMLATPWVIGLDMNTKLWGRFRVDELESIDWNDESYENLILPEKEKELAWAFVKNKALADSTKFEDFVKDKGRGIIILMFGPPGVGKSYTAEAVAERARVPLYTMSAATLGTNPKRVGDCLEYALNLCRAWNAMLFLDEADIFLGSRSDADLTRNELVAVFLTKLEYYQGICFMTTNRMSSIDLAMQSRVDLFLRYGDLTQETRYCVWKNFISGPCATRFDISDEDLDKLSKYELNGREIKNLVKTAHLLSLGNADEKIGLGTLCMLVDNRIQALETLKGA
ncbi:unnamed protein product [Clonostachys solani]|uniref:AAA+ ATPase domain-containing protein n=1 Tax=Clonostachys solani TaxID=160281 RepID=A0A9P0EEI6_9HYPO|nr:unnamed protein product [Clonostachys solani]